VADGRVDVECVGGVQLVRVEFTCRCGDDLAGASEIGVALFGFLFCTGDGEEDLGNGPLALCFGWLALWLASYASAALAVANDLRRRLPSASRQSAKNLLFLRNTGVLLALSLA
jgi:uncharacterized membrane protein